VLSPADRAYLDMKYDASTPIGLDWAALVPVQRAYDWDPDATVPAARAGTVLGVEAPLWSETTATIRDIEYLAMPRLAEIAEVAWSPQSVRRWETFKIRLGAQAPRWTAMGINFFRAPEVPWRLLPTTGG
jgi:hexosaminidase